VFQLLETVSTTSIKLIFQSGSLALSTLHGFRKAVIGKNSPHLVVDVVVGLDSRFVVAEPLEVDLRTRKTGKECQRRLCVQSSKGRTLILAQQIKNGTRTGRDLHVKN
jgi:hypothetical protein